MREKFCLVCGGLIREFLEPIITPKSIVEFKDIDMCNECCNYLGDCPEVVAEKSFSEIRWMYTKINRLNLFLDQLVKKGYLNSARREEMRKELQR